MAKSKNCASLKTIVLTSVVGVLFVAAVVGFFLPFLTTNVYITDVTVTVFKFESGLGITALIFSILAFVCLLGTATFTVLKFTKVKVPAIVKLIVYIATAVFGVLAMIMTMAYCADISKPLVDFGLNAYTLTFTAFMFTLGSAAAGIVALVNKD